jgi:prepilin-type N-terminal cleavage/methylation domain-containing protein
MLTFARRLRREDDGFSLVELLTAMAIGSVILGALMLTVTRATGFSIQTSNRVEALQQGRQTMDRVVTLLNSQICLVRSDGSGTPPIIVGDANQIAFYASLGAVDTAPSIYRLTYNPATRRLTQDRYDPTGTTANPAYPGYPASPTRTTVIGTNLLPSSAGAPIFKYFKFVTTEGPTLGMVDLSDPNGLSTPLTAAQQAVTVRVTTSFIAQPLKVKSATAVKQATTLEGVGVVASANPGEPDKGVTC